MACWVLMTLFDQARADEFSGFGPVPVRNHQPIQQIFLNLPVERARTLPAGTVEAHIESVQSNTIVKVNNHRTQAELKLESNRTVFSATLGLRPGLEIGIHLPFISRFGGFLDPFIDAVEDFLGTTNAERDDFPDNSFGAFFVRRGDTELFAGGRESFALGDVWLSAKRELLHDPDLPLISLRAAVKAPTGDAESVTGSGKPDFGLGLAAEYQPMPWLVLYGNLSGIYPVGPITPARLTLNPMLIEAVAAEARIWRSFSLLLQQETYTSPMHGNETRLLDGVVVEITVGANLQWRSALLQLAVVDNVSPLTTAADFSLLLRCGYRL